VRVERLLRRLLMAADGSAPLRPLLLPPTAVEAARPFGQHSSR